MAGRTRFGTHSSVNQRHHLGATLVDKRRAALLVHKGTIGDQFDPSDPVSVDAYKF
jgi:hypothetical protein